MRTQRPHVVPLAKAEAPTPMYAPVKSESAGISMVTSFQILS
jgi:hypothetical protein